jgi:hypothetical protein
MSGSNASVLGEHFDVPIPENSHPAITVAVIDSTSSGTFTPEQLRNTVWSLRYQALCQYNRSPWVERDYSAPVADVVLVAADAVPVGAWLIELLDTSDQPGAIGYHEDKSRISKAGPSGAHSSSGVALHPQTGEQIPLSKVFCATAREDGVPVTEVGSHEMLEMAVDPWVMNESEIRVYANPADGKEYIGEVGDPVQDRAYDVGAPEGRPCGVPEAYVSDFAYPGWWGQAQRRGAVCFCDDAESWKTLPSVPHLKAFELAGGGYMSVREKGGEWTQIYGSARAKAEANAHAYERPGETG